MKLKRKERGIMNKKLKTYVPEIIKSETYLDHDLSFSIDKVFFTQFLFINLDDYRRTKRKEFKIVEDNPFKFKPYHNTIIL